MITTEQIIQAFKSKRAEERAPVLRLEMDYELASLHDALVLGDTEAAEASKSRLEEMRRELIMLEC
ncbi:hypothetical protein D3C75_695500 [compost metagenome]